MMVQNQIWQMCRNAGVANPQVYPLSIDRWVVKLPINETTISQLFSIMLSIQNVEGVISVLGVGDWNSMMITAGITKQMELIVTTG